MARNRMARVYVGDIGTIIEPKPVYPGELVDLSQLPLTYRQKCQVALACGIPVKDIVGVEHCYDHEDLLFLGGREMPEGMNMWEHTVYCKNCFQWFRVKDKNDVDFNSE